MAGQAAKLPYRKTDSSEQPDAADIQGLPDAQQKDMLNELLVDHYSNTLFLVWQWSAVKCKICDKEQAIKYLLRLLLIQ